jgi:hypothetical protein
MTERLIEMKSVSGANYRLSVKSSPIHGDGVFAAEDIPWGRKILEYRGAIINDAEAAKRIRAGADAIMELGSGRNSPCYSMWSLPAAFEQHVDP